MNAKHVVDGGKVSAKTARQIASIPTPSALPKVEPKDGIAKGKVGFTFQSVMLEAVIASAAIVVGKREGTAVSQHMLQLAQQSDSVASFIKAVSETEKYIKSDEGKAAALSALDETDYNLTANDTAAVVGVVPGQWRQYRNNIKRAWEMGILPSEYKTEAALRNALNAKRNAASGKDVLLKAVNEVKANLSAILKSAKDKSAKDKAGIAIAIREDGAKFAKLAASLVPVKPEAPKAGTVSKSKGTRTRRSPESPAREVAAQV